jgi:adenine-specific DNA-methyltransferase
MNENYLSELELLLSKNEDYVVEGKVNKNKVAELAHKYDAELVDLLADSKAMRRLFFVETKKDVLVFNKDKFIQFISNKEFLPDSYTSYKNKIGLGTGTELLSEKKEVVLNWAYKDCVLEGGQDKEDAKRDEVFHNEVLAPDQIDRLLDDKVLTGWKKFDENGEHDAKELTDDDNLIIRGNNLLALHSLKKRYAGKVKLIYIDPPYNTGSDSFGYNDSFNHSTWLTFMRNRLSVAKELLSIEGVIFVQCDDGEQGYLKVLLDEIFGRGNFINTISVNMKNVAGASGGGEDKRLKKNIEFVHIFAKSYDSVPSFSGVYDYIPVHELVQQYKEEGKSWKYTSVLVSPGNKESIGSAVDGDGNDIKIYKRTGAVIKSVNQLTKDEGISEEQVYKKYASKIFQTAMPQSSIRPRVMEKVKELRVQGDFFSIEYQPRSGRNKGKVYEQFYKGEAFRLLAWLGDVSEERDGVLCKKETLGTYWDVVGETKNLTKEGSINFPNGKKPEKLIENIIDMTTEKGDLVLDYHLGSGTTAAVAHKMGRQYIGIEQLDYGDNDSVKRLVTVINGDKSGSSKSVDWSGGGTFVYAHLMDLGNKFVQKVKNASTDKELVELLEQAKKSSFLSYKVDPEKINPGDKDFANLSIAHKKQLLLELVDHNHLYVNYTEIDDTDYGVSAEDKKLNKQFYGN